MLLIKYIFYTDPGIVLFVWHCSNLYVLVGLDVSWQLFFVLGRGVVGRWWKMGSYGMEVVGFEGLGQMLSCKIFRGTEQSLTIRDRHEERGPPVCVRGDLCSITRLTTAFPQCPVFCRTCISIFFLPQESNRYRTARCKPCCVPNPWTRFCRPYPWFSHLRRAGVHQSLPESFSAVPENPKRADLSRSP